MAMSQMKRYASGNLATLPEDLRCELLLVQISRLSKSVKSLMAELKDNFKVLDERETYIELQRDVMSRLKDANSALTRKLMECCCQQNIGKLNCVVEIQGDDKVGCASLSISDITLAADSDLAREKIASACFIRQEKHFVSVTSFTSEKIEGNTSGRSLNLKNYGTSMKRSETCLTNNLSFNSLRRRFKTYMNRMTKDGGFRYSWSGRQDDEKIIGGKAMKPMNSEGDLWSYVNKGFQNQDLLDNGGAGNRLDDVNNLLLGGGGGDSDAYQAAAPGGSSRNLYVPRQRLMHFDLKGAPPRVSYLKRILPLVKELGATGVLMEWEDMFPWSGHLAPLAAGNAYSRQDVQEIIDAAVNNGLEVIPLVQTFGHVEFALKHSDFTELREVPESPQALCPSLNTSHDFVHQMIEQVMDMHKNIRYLHIGCDEVFQMGECVRCRTQPRDSLFLNHVTRVASFVRTRYPGVTPIIWDDMLRHLPPISLEQFRIGELVEPMVWVYAEDVYRFVPTSVWEKYAAIFPRVWAASAFKGAFGETLYVPNAKRHLENNMRWLQVMQAEAPKFTGGFQGIAITGWQRYDHFAVLCELLPSAIPSLAVNLLVTSHGYFNQSLRPKLHNSLSCGVFVPSGGLDRSSSFLSLNNDPFLFDQFSRCVFPGHAFFRLLYRLSTVEREVAEAVAMIRKDKGWMTDYNVRHNFSSPLRVDELMVDHQRLYHSVTSLVRGAKDALWEIFDAYTVAEWIEQRIYPMVQQLESISRDSITLKQPRTWPKRPFPILSDLHRIGLQFAADASPG